MSEKVSSVATPKSVIGVLVIMISIGASISLSDMPVPEPMCMQIVVPSSAQAFQKGSQWSAKREGCPRPVGVSGNEIA